MKKKLLSNTATAGLLLLSAVSIAQPTLTATGINPVLGESFTFYNSGYASPGSAGANQTWDLSSTAGTSSGLSNVVTPSATTYGSSFPNANVATNNSTANSCNYYKTTSSALESYGLTSGATVIQYSNPEDFLHYPFNYNNSYTDPWEASFVNGGYTFYRTGSTTVTADGYGTLITPTATYTNVTRVHFVQTYQDSSYVGMPYVITYVNDEYMWYKDGNHTQLAFVFTLTPSSGNPVTGGAYLFANSVGVNSMPDFITSSSLFPNPASDVITASFSLSESKNVVIELYNELGQKMDFEQGVEGVQGLNTVPLDIAGLPKGVYFTHILLDGIVASTGKFVITK